MKSPVSSRLGGVSMLSSAVCREALRPMDMALHSRNPLHLPGRRAKIIT
jgi:hypothetical protein